MSQAKTVIVAAAAAIFAAQSARADFLVGSWVYFNVHVVDARIVHNDGSNAVVPTSGSLFPHESYDTFILSADAQRFYGFANDLGTITVESWSSTSGAYAGPVGPNFAGVGQPWPPGFRPGYGIGDVHTRANFPAFGGDLLFASPLGLSQSGGFVFDKPVIHIINTNSQQLVEQIVPPTSVSSIYNFALGPGMLGPQSRAYVNTEDGLFVFNESATTILIGVDPNTFEPIFDNTHFRLDSPTPLLTNLSPTASFDIGPVDGYLYVLDGIGSDSSIKRYDTNTGALIDTFLTFAQYNYGGGVGDHLKFGPDGGLYFSSGLGNHFIVSRFETATGLRTAAYDLGVPPITNFYVLPVPEPASVGLVLAACACLTNRTRGC